MEAEEVGTVEAQTVGIFRPIPRMKTDKRTTPNVVILLPGFLRGESPGGDWALAVLWAGEPPVD